MGRAGSLILSWQSEESGLLLSPGAGHWRQSRHPRWIYRGGKELRRLVEAPGRRCCGGGCQSHRHRPSGQDESLHAGQLFPSPGNYFIHESVNLNVSCRFIRPRVTALAWWAASGRWSSREAWPRCGGVTASTCWRSRPRRPSSSWRTNRQASVLDATCSECYRYL